MFQIDFQALRWTRPALLGVMLLITATAAAASGVGASLNTFACSAAPALELEHTVRGFGAEAAPACFTLDVPAAGVLLVDATGEGQPRLELTGRCGTAPEGSGAAVLERLAASLLLAVDPGAYAFCVMAQDPAAALGDYKLTSGFLAALGPKDGDPREEEPMPDPTLPPPPSSLLAGSPKSGDSREEEPMPDPTLPPIPPVGSGSLVDDRAVAELCARMIEDDHADSFHCATRLGTDDEVYGELGNAWADDEDLFLLTLDEMQTVRIEAQGTSAAVDVYDRYGLRLWTATEHDADGSRLVTTLGPSWYFVRVRANAGTTGAYRLRTGAIND